MSAKSQPWLTIRNEANKPAEILIQGTIGKDWWDDSGISEKEFTDALQAIPEDRPITIGINSEGGSVKDGLGIYHALLRRGDKVTTRVDGYALSIASVVALAGARRISPSGAMWMIHEPWTVASGNAEDMLKTAAMLEIHGDAIAAIYRDRAGITLHEAREKMKAETWFRGGEAVTLGFATETNEEPVALAKFDASKFKNIPHDLLSQIFGSTHGKGDTHNATAETECNPVTPAAAALSPASAVDGKAEPPINPATNSNTKDPMTDTNTPAAPNQTADDRIAALELQVKALANKPVSTGPAQITREGLNDLLKPMPRGKKRFEFLRDNWGELSRSYPVIYDANTDTAAGALTPAVLAEGFITVLQNRLAPLNAFARNFTATAAQGKRNIIEVPIATAGGTAQSGATSFEDTTNFVGTMDDIAITPAQITVGAHITNAELTNGWRMGWFAEIKAAEMADKLQSLVNAIITTTNFDRTSQLEAGTSAVVATSTNFTKDDLDNMWGSIAKSPIKNVMLHQNYYKYFLPATLENFNPLAGNTLPGWDGFYLNTNWTGAETNTYGFACNPQAICIGAMLPAEAPNMIGASNLAREVVTVPGIGLSVASYTWFSTASRTGWWTMDVLFGAAKGDPAAGCLLKSA
jgi:ATP-dependent protease ClpP protease subunit